MSEHRCEFYPTRVEGGVYVMQCVCGARPRLTIAAGTPTGEQ